MTKKNLVILSAIGALVALTGCAPAGGSDGSSVASSASDSVSAGETSSSDSVIAGETSSSESEPPAVAVSGITNELPSYFAVGQTVNLDDYITVTYADGNTDHNYEVTANDENLITIEGHTMTLLGVGQVRLTITAGTRSQRATIDIRSEENIEVINWISETGLDGVNSSNFTIHLFDVDSTGGLAYANLSYLRTETYACALDITDPDAENEESVLAYLSDGKAYWGGWDAEGNLSFLPGDDSSMYQYYYFTMPWEIDAASFGTSVEVDEETGEVSDYVAGDATTSEAVLDLVNGWGYRLTTTFGATMDECLAQLIDLDGDNEDELLLFPTFSIGGQFSYLYYLIIDDVGETHQADVEAAQADPEMVPAPVDATPIKNEFTYLASQTNFTVSYLIYGGYTEDGTPDLTATGDGLQYLFGQSTGALMLTHEFTEEGVVTTLTEYDPTTSSWVVGAVYGYFNVAGTDGADDSVVAFALGADDTYTNTPVTGATDFATLDAVVAKSPAAVNPNDWMGLNYTGYEVTGTTSIFSGAVGNDDGTTKTNGALQAILNGYDCISLGGEGIGNFWCEETDGWSGGGMASLGQYWDYSSIVVDSEAHGISITIDMMFPFSDVNDSYAYMAYSVSEIGTTEVDFSQYVATEAA